MSSDWLLIKWTPLKVATLAYHPSVTLIIRDQAPVFEKKGDPQIQSINRNAPNLPSPSLGHIVSERRNLWWACQSSPNAGQAKFAMISGKMPTLVRFLIPVTVLHSLHVSPPLRKKEPGGKLSFDNLLG